MIKGAVGAEESAADILDHRLAKSGRLMTGQPQPRGSRRKSRVDLKNADQAWDDKTKDKSHQGSMMINPAVEQ